MGEASHVTSGMRSDSVDFSHFLPQRCFKLFMATYCAGDWIEDCPRQPPHEKLGRYPGMGIALPISRWSDWASSLDLFFCFIFLPILFPRRPRRQLTYYFGDPAYLHFNRVLYHMDTVLYPTSILGTSYMPEAGIQPGPPDRDDINVAMRNHTAQGSNGLL